MARRIDRVFEHSPRLSRAYPRALAKAVRGGDAPWPEYARVRQSGVVVDGARLDRYQRVCGFADQATALLVYPHVVAFPLQMALMTDRRFPLNLLGLIHTANQIERYRPIEVGEPLDICVAVDAQRDFERGREFELVTTMTAADGAPIWHERGTLRALGQSNTGPKARSQPPLPDFDHSLELSVPADIGRRYARVAGDFNPIHLGRWPARLFGFRRAIATGMWLQARVLAALAPALSQPPAATAIRFKKPVYLPATPELRYGCAVEETTFALVEPAGRIIHVEGRVEPAVEARR